VSDRTRVWLDTETTSLDPRFRRPWEIAMIVRRPGERDSEPWQWFIHPADLDLPNANPDSLRIGGFWERHPNADFLADGGEPHSAPHLPGVYRLREVLPVIARETSDRAVICGSNPAFDMVTLEVAMLEAGITPGWHYHGEDVPSVARGWLLGRGLEAPRKSDDIARACGINPDDFDRHSALGDCRLFRALSDVVEGRVLA
jgi:hypothetical protein